jgi:hypothetical protein
VCRGDDTDVDLDAVVAAQRLDRPFLQHAQQLCLCGLRQLGDFVQEQGAAVRGLEAALAAVGRAGEGAAFVAEQLRLDQRVGKCGAVDRDEGFAASPAAVVKRVRDQLLAGSALARDDHRRVAVGDGLDALDDDLHLG